MRRLARWAPAPWAWVSAVAWVAAMWWVLREPWTRLAGEEFLDGMGTQWFYWYAGELLQGEPLEHSQLLFFPYGKEVFLHTGGNLVDAFLALRRADALPAFD